MKRLKILRGYMHKLDLSSLKAEIEHKLGKKNTAALVWGARKETHPYNGWVSFTPLPLRFPARAGGYISVFVCR